jgi:3-oxoacyl-[acyl-carrier protein] reductase
MSSRLEGKVALITGAGAGLGAQMARRFHEEGAAKIVINDLRPEAAEKVAKEVGGLAIAADVADSAAVAAMFAQVDAEIGRLDILVNNAGFGLDGDEASRQRLISVPAKQMEEAMSGGPITTHFDSTVELSDERWQRMIDVHLNGTFYGCREGLKIMNRQNSGAIINMGSIMGTTGGAASLAYCAAKGAILALTRSLAREVVSRNIRVNALAPGFIDTELVEPLGEMRGLLEMATPMGRFGDTDDVAYAAVYLASEEAKFVTGQTLSPNGGFVMNQ